jgi:glycosyltransferase involved in cell wall biosynthesis
MRVVSQGIERLARPLSDIVIAVSEYEQRLAIQKGVCARNQIQTIYNGLPDTPLHARHGANSVPVLAMISRFAPPKEQEAVVRALSGVRQDFKLLFVGDGPTRPHVERVAVECGMGERVEFLGTRHDIEEILANADILVHASRYEALCLSVVEAMRACLPVVVWASGGIEELVESGVTGYMAKDAQEFAKYTENLLADASLRQRFGTVARQKFLAFLTIDETLRRTSQVYEDVLAAKQKGVSHDALPVGSAVQ